MKDTIFVKTYCAIRNGNKIIMTQDKEGQPGWKFPGGHVEEKELIRQALEREILEEIGITAKVEDLLLIEDYFNRKRPDEHNISFFFLGEMTKGRLQPKHDEVDKITELTLDEVRNLESVYPPHKNAVLKLLRNQQNNMGEIFIEK